MAQLLTRAALGAALELIERRVPSPVLGGELLIRELLRTEYDAAQQFATTGKVDGQGRPLVHVDRVNAAIFAAGVMDPESGDPYADGRRDDAGNLVVDPRTRRPLVTAEEVLAWPARPDLVDHIVDVAQAILDLSEVATPKS